MSTPKVRQVAPMWVIEPDSNVAIEYRPRPDGEYDEMVCRFTAGVGAVNGCLTVIMDPETAIRHYGQLGAAIREWDRRQQEKIRCQEIAEVRP